MQQKDDLEFDDQEAISFISNYLKENSQNAEDDDIQYILDIIFEYYEKQDLFETETKDNASLDDEDLFKYISNIIKKEGIIKLDDDTIQTILDGEYEYGKSIGIYK